MALTNLASSIKRFVLILISLVVLTLVSVYLFDQLVAEQIGLTGVFRQTGRALVVVIFGAVTILFIRRSKHLLSRHVGAHAQRSSSSSCTSPPP